METKLERLAALERKQAQIKARIQALKARDSMQERKDDTRRKVLVGGFVMARLREKGIHARELTFEGVRFVDGLKADRDRRLFGIQPLSPSDEGGGAV